MNKLKETLTELDEVFAKNKIGFVLTRYNPKDTKLSDLDILVEPTFFIKAIRDLGKHGYGLTSHDKALGGRLPGMQVNLDKISRLTIDLHQGFTWRKTKYLDQSLIWNNSKNTKVAGVNIEVPDKTVDLFLLMINIIFEKTYFTKSDYQYFWGQKNKIFKNIVFTKQAKKYGWNKTYFRFRKWTEKVDKPINLPLFLPTSLVVFSYFEKFLHDWRVDIISFSYYFFFRFRFMLNKKLPYD